MYLNNHLLKVYEAKIFTLNYFFFFFTKKNIRKSGLEVRWLFNKISFEMLVTK